MTTKQRLKPQSVHLSGRCVRATTKIFFFKKKIVERKINENYAVPGMQFLCRRLRVEGFACYTRILTPRPPYDRSSRGIVWTIITVSEVNVFFFFFFFHINRVHNR